MRHRLAPFAVVLLLLVSSCYAGKMRSSSSSRKTSSSSSSWGKRPSHSPSYPRQPAPAPSYPRQPAPAPASSYPRQPAYNPSYPSSPSYNPSSSISRPGVYTPGVSGAGSATRVANQQNVALSYPTQHKPATGVGGVQPQGPPAYGWNVNRPGTSGFGSKPVGSAPPAYPGLHNAPVSSNVKPPAYSPYTPKQSAPSYNSHSYSKPPAPPAYSSSAQGVKPYQTASNSQGYKPYQTNTANYPRQQAPVGPPVNNYGTSNGYGGGYGHAGYGGGYPSHGYGGYGGYPSHGYGGGYGGSPMGGYGGSPMGGYGYPMGGYGASPMMGGLGGFGSSYGGGFGGFGNSYGGYQQSRGSGIGSLLLTAGVFYGLGRVTSPGGLFGSSYGSYGSHSPTQIHHHHYYDHAARQNTAAVAPAPAPGSDPLPPLAAVPIAGYPGTVQQPTLSTNGTTGDEKVYGIYGAGGQGIITPGTPGGAPPVPAIPRFDLNKTKLYQPIAVPFDEVYKGPLDSFPLWLNDSILFLPVYGYDYPNWNETEIIPFPKSPERLVSSETVSVNELLPRNNIETTTEVIIITTTPKPKEESFASKLGNMLLSLGNYFGFGKKSEPKPTMQPSLTSVTPMEHDSIDTVPLATYDRSLEVGDPGMLPRFNSTI